MNAPLALTYNPTLTSIKLIDNDGKMREVARNIPLLDAMKAVIAMSNDTFWDFMSPGVLERMVRNYENGDTIYDSFTVTCAGGWLRVKIKE